MGYVEVQYPVNDVVSSLYVQGEGNSSVKRLLEENDGELSILRINKRTIDILKEQNIKFFAEKSDSAIRKLDFPESRPKYTPYVAVVPKRLLGQVKDVLQNTTYGPLINHMRFKNFPKYHREQIASEYLFLREENGKHIYKRRHHKSNSEIEIHSKEFQLLKGKLQSRNYDLQSLIDDPWEYLNKQPLQGRPVSMDRSFGREI